MHPARTLVRSCLAATLAVAAPSAAFACGGFFCNSAEPVNQADEQILFARQGDQVEMHVQIRYAGPPVGFGWLLPVPADVETAVSTDQLFTALGRRYAPSFRLRTVFVDGCEEPQYPVAEAGPDAGMFAESDMAGEPQPEGVNVLSREAVGPYDRVILQAERVDALLAWLDQNDFQVPMGGEERLAEYVDSSVFVALKLLPGADTDDIRPLRLRFTAPAPAVPIRPTAVAAEPDMGVVVYMLGEGRMVPRNYLHVQVNEAIIEWETGGANYRDAVSHAVDEAGGRAFVTDYAGNLADLPDFDLPIDLPGLAEVRTLEELRAYRSVLQSSDLRPLVRDAITPPEGVSVDDVLARPWDYDWTEIPCDGAWLAATIEESVQPVWRELDTLFARHGSITRLFSTLSPAEMDVDPIFDLNPDLPSVAAERWGERLVDCGDDEWPDYDTALVTTASGLQYRLVQGRNPNAVRRAGGETVRGADEVGAAVVERPFAAGPFETMTDNRPAIAERYGMDPDGPVDQPEDVMDGVGGMGGGGGAGGSGGAGPDGGVPIDGGGVGAGPGCACDAADGSPVGWLWVGLLMLGGVRRRRR